jgi:hypothetical protein
LLSVSNSRTVIEPAEEFYPKKERPFTEVFVWGCDRRGQLGIDSHYKSIEKIKNRPDV